MTEHQQSEPWPPMKIVLAHLEEVRRILKPLIDAELEAGTGTAFLGIDAMVVEALWLVKGRAAG